MTESGKESGKTFTWTDYQNWPDDEQWEIIGGEAFVMTPSPLERHQYVCGELFAALRTFFKSKKCAVYFAPMDVRFSETDVVQPDLLVVCDPKQRRMTHIEGPPRLIVEVLSPSSAVYDRGKKLTLYARSGVHEVWLATPYPSSIEVFVLDGDSYRLKATHGREDKLVSQTFPELAIVLDPIFDFPVDPDERIHVGKEVSPRYSTR